MGFKVRVIKPYYELSEDKEIIITHFIDETGEKKTWETILEEAAVQTKLYCFMYQPVVAYVEKYCKTHNYHITPFNGEICYTGKIGKRNVFFAAHLINNISTNTAAPTTRAATIYYEGKDIRLLNVDKWMSGINNFHITDSVHRNLYEVLCYLEEHIIDKYYTPFRDENRWSKVPVTLAALSRALITIPETSLTDLPIRGAYISGYNWVKNTDSHSKLYYYDTKSMYPYILMNRLFPNPSYAPALFNGFKKGELAFYHISYLKCTLKPNHFPTVFCQKEQQKRMKLSNNINIDWLDLSDEYEGWITSIDLQMLERDYNIEALEIDKTYLYTHTKDNVELFGNNLLRYFNCKENATNPIERQAYKLIINTYSGSLGMQGHFKYRIDDLTNPTGFKPIRKMMGATPMDIAAFMTAYARQYITELALKAGYENVACISTDAVVVKDPSPLTTYVGDNLGNLSLEKVMYNAHWWRPCAYEWQDEEGEWHGKVSGLPTYKYEHGKLVYAVPKIIYDTEKHIYKRDVLRYSIEEENNEE